MEINPRFVVRWLPCSSTSCFASARVPAPQRWHVGGTVPLRANCAHGLASECLEHAVEPVHLHRLRFPCVGRDSITTPELPATRAAYSRGPDTECTSARRVRARCTPRRRTRACLQSNTSITSKTNTTVPVKPSQAISTALTVSLSQRNDPSPCPTH